MKLFVKVLCFGLVLALAGPFLMRGSDGKPLYTPDQAWQSLQTSLPSLDVPEVLPSEPVEVYRWQDASGQWHFSGTPPVEGTAYTVLAIDPKMNAVGTAPAPRPVADDSDTEASEPAVLGPESAMLGPYPNPEAVKQLLQDVQAIREDAERRAIQGLEADAP
ncbi:MAG: DUF4124 domain-containing protein [Pseudomonadota bacterium]